MGNLEMDAFLVIWRLVSCVFPIDNRRNLVMPMLFFMYPIYKALVFLLFGDLSSLSGVDHVLAKNGRRGSLSASTLRLQERTCVVDY